MVKNFSIQELNDHYAKRHKLRKGIFGEKPYANYGYWIREKMNIDEACDAMVDLVAREFDIAQDDQILECGCGYGASLIYLATRYKPKKLIGIDVTDIRVQTGKQAIKENNLEDKIELKFGDATNLEFNSESFTKVMAIECAFHFNTRKDFFHEAFRVLKPGGILAMTDIVASLEINFSDYTLSQIRDFLSADAKCYSDDNIYSIDTYKKFLKEAGFDLIKIYSIKDKVITQFADHLEKVAQVSEADAKAKRLKVAKSFRTKYMLGGDYIIVRAQKPTG